MKVPEAQIPRLKGEEETEPWPTGGQARGGGSVRHGTRGPLAASRGRALSSRSAVAPLGPVLASSSGGSAGTPAPAPSRPSESRSATAPRPILSGPDWVAGLSLSQSL